ncbi:MAG: GFA family protein [Pseudomonadota bacterium]
MTPGARITASCHCGAVRISAVLRTPTSQAARCNCSFCRRRQAANVSCDYSSLEIEKGKDALRLYQFGTCKAEHYFCGTCGIYTHHRRFSDQTEIGVNLGAVEGAEVWTLEPIPWNDGRNL